MIEAVTEDLGVKAGVFDHLDALMPADVILASNTSSIPIAELASTPRTQAGSSGSTSSPPFR